jgi:hypothetical protein
MTYSGRWCGVSVRRWTNVGGARTAVLWTPHQRYAVLALHGRRDGVAEELRFGPELADDADLVRRRNVEESGYGWVVRY